MEAYFPRVLIAIIAIILGISFNRDVGEPQKSAQVEQSVVYQQSMDIIKEQSIEASTTLVSGQTVLNTIARNSGRSNVVIKLNGTVVSGTPTINSSDKYTQIITSDNGIITYEFTKSS